MNVYHLRAFIITDITPYHKPGAGNAESAATGVRAKSLGQNKNRAKKHRAAPHVINHHQRAGDVNPRAFITPDIAPQHNPGAGNAGSKATGVRAKSLTRNKGSRNRNAFPGLHHLRCNAAPHVSHTNQRAGDVNPRGFRSG